MNNHFSNEDTNNPMFSRINNNIFLEDSFPKTKVNIMTTDDNFYISEEDSNNLNEINVDNINIRIDNYNIDSESEKPLTERNRRSDKGRKEKVNVSLGVVVPPLKGFNKIESNFLKEKNEQIVVYTHRSDNLYRDNSTSRQIRNNEDIYREMVQVDKLKRKNKYASSVNNNVFV